MTSSLADGMWRAMRFVHSVSHRKKKDVEEQEDAQSAH